MTKESEKTNVDLGNLSSDIDRLMAGAENETANYESEQAAAYEIAPGMTSEEMRAEFFDTDALIEAPEKVYRLNTSGHRYYYTFDELSNEPDFFVSVTTFIKQTMPTSPQLIKWIADMGYDESKAYAAERAGYGTFMHTQIADLLINKVYDLNSLKSRLKMYIESEQLPVDFINHADELKKDILAFAQFMIETDLKPLAIEIVLTHPTDGYAGAVDLVAEMDIEEKGFFGEHYKTGANAGKPKESKRVRRILGIVDFKSGRKGFYEEHEIQIAAYREMWNLRFESTPVERIFNWSPKDWRGKTPTYNLKDQTDSKNLRKLPLLVELARIETDKRNGTIIASDGIINLNENKNLGANISEYTLSELVKKRKIEQDTPKKETDTGTIEDIAGTKANPAPTSSESELKQGNTPKTKSSDKKSVKTTSKGDNKKGSDSLTDLIDF